MTALGASLRHDGTTFRIWAPHCRSVDLVVDGHGGIAMREEDDNVFAATLADVRDGTRYQYRLDGRRYRPDPVSRYQPDGVHGASVVVDPTRFEWSDAGFRGHARGDLVFYELHVGTFTAAGTFEAVIPHLPRLVDLGITALELMPIAEFPGSRNWGYDGVDLYAPQSTYGGPRGLRRLVDACHRAGLSVFLDVVYNHLGPEGNYLSEFGPYFTDRYKTPWGPAINFDGPDSAGVRRHFVDNARYWVREFHVDGLRLDAIHAIHDASPVHVLTEIAEAVRVEAAMGGRPVHVIAESHDNDRAIVRAASEGGLGLDAVWSDDFHHATHSLLTGERVGYYADFADGTVGKLVRALTEGFAFQGEPSIYFGHGRGTPSADLAGDRFVVFLQNHDQVGNRAAGDRLGTLVGLDTIKLAAALMFVAPALPLIFMGEEYAETAPFQFFTSFLDPELAEAVRLGRRAEFNRFRWEGDIPDPGAPATFVRSRINHALATAPHHRELFQYYRRWLELRSAHPALGPANKSLTRARLDDSGAVLTVWRTTPAGDAATLLANLGGDHRPWPRPTRLATPLVDSADVRFGGKGEVIPLLPQQVVLYDGRHWE